MQDREALDHYFTEQVVGEPFVVEMGSHANVRHEPARALRLHMLLAEAELMGHAAKGLFDPLSTDLGNGQPASVRSMARARRRLLVISLVVILAAWTAGLWGLSELLGPGGHFQWAGR